MRTIFKVSLWITFISWALFILISTEILDSFLLEKIHANDKEKDFWKNVFAITGVLSAISGVLSKIIEIFEIGKKIFPKRPPKKKKKPKKKDGD